MRIAHTGDLHITRGPRLADQADTLNRMVDAMLAERPDLVILGGDLYGREVPHLSHPEERAVLFPAVARLAQVAPVIVIQGNHDDPRDIAALAHLDSRWSILVVTRPAHLSVYTPSGAVSVYAVPYPTRRGLLEEVPRDVETATTQAAEAIEGLLLSWRHAIRTARKTDTRHHILATHASITGARLAGGEVLSGHELELSGPLLAEIPVNVGLHSHIHQRQEVLAAHWYAGAPWRTDFAEDAGDKAWTLALLGADAPDGHLDVRAIPTGCRAFRTLAYRWADDGRGVPCWTQRPTPAEVSRCAEAEVRMRLIVPEHLVSSCPWEEEVAHVAALATRVQVERVIEPVLRVRAPKVASASTPADKMRAYWATLGTPPSPAEQAAAFDALDALGGAKLAPIVASLCP